MNVTRRVGAGLVAAALTASLAAACGRGGGNDGRAATGRPGTSIPETTPSSEIPTTAAPVTTTTAAAGSGRTSTTRRATTPTTAASGPAVTVAAARPVKPARPGTYRYATTGTSTVGLSAPAPLPGVTTLVVEPPAGSRQHWTRDLRDTAGNGSVTELTGDYRTEGIFIEELKAASTVGGYSQGRILRAPAPLLFLPTGAVAGHHLDLEMSVIGGTGGTARITVDVLREEAVSIAGSTINALVAKVVVVLPPGDISGRSELTVWLDRSSGLFVRDESVSDASAAGGLFKLHTEYQATLQSLSPA